MPLTRKQKVFKVLKLGAFGVVAFVIMFGTLIYFFFDAMFAAAEVWQQPRVSDSTDAGAVRIFFVGNSLTFTNSIPAILQQFIESGLKKPTKIWQVMVPGRTLEQHWKDGAAAQVLKQHGPFDLMVIQGASTEPKYLPQQFMYYGYQLGKLAKENGAKPVLFETYADENDTVNQQPLTDGYDKLGRALVAPVVPVGEAWFYAVSKNPKLKLWAVDRHHPSGDGSYYSACVFYAYLFSKNPAGLPSKIIARNDSRNRDVVIADLKPALAAELQSLAWDFFQSHARRVEPRAR